METTSNNTFHEHDLVTWHQINGQRSIPLPGVVVRLQPDCVVIRTRLQNALKEIQVNAEQLATRE